MIQKYFIVLSRKDKKMEPYIFISHSHVFDTVMYKSEYDCKTMKENKHISDKNKHEKTATSMIFM